MKKIILSLILIGTSGMSMAQELNNRVPSEFRNDPVARQAFQECVNTVGRDPNGAANRPAIRKCMEDKKINMPMSRKQRINEYAQQQAQQRATQTEPSEEALQPLRIQEQPRVQANSQPTIPVQVPQNVTPNGQPQLPGQEPQPQVPSEPVQNPSQGPQLKNPTSNPAQTQGSSRTQAPNPTPLRPQSPPQTMPKQ